MISPSIYIYIIFFVVLFYLIKEGYWKDIFKTIYRRISKNKAKFFAAIILIVVSIEFVDLPVKNFFVGYESSLIEAIVKFGNELGKGEIHFSILLLLIIIFMIFKKELIL